MITTGRNQVTVIGIGPEQLIDTIEEEPEWKEYLNIGTFNQHALVTFPGIFQIAHTNSVRSFSIAYRIEWI